MAKLQHPNIVNLLDYYEDDRGAYLVMEYVPGLTLEDYISKRSGPITGDRLIRFLKQMLDGIAYVHSKGIIHRDIKPSNFMVTEDGTVKVLDLGIAKLLEAGDHKLTKTGTHIGTVSYMSPEQVKGQPVDVRSDIYSLGVTLYQMATAHRPYDNEQSEFLVYDQIVNHPFPKACKKYPSVSSQIEGLIETATAKDPKSRFQSCDAFLAALNGDEVYSSKSNRREEGKATPTAISYSDDSITHDFEQYGTISIRQPKSRKVPLLLLGYLPLLFIVLAVVFWPRASQIDGSITQSHGSENSTPQIQDSGKDSIAHKPKQKSKQPNNSPSYPSSESKENPTSINNNPEETHLPTITEDKPKTSKAKADRAYKRMTLLNDIEISNDPAIVALSGWGILPFGVIVRNQSDYLIEFLEVTIEYLRTDRSVAGKNKIFFRDIPPHDEIAKMAMRYDAGKTVRLSISSAKSSELEFCFEIGKRGPDPDDPYYCR